MIPSGINLWIHLSLFVQSHLAYHFVIEVSVATFLNVDGFDGDFLFSKFNSLSLQLRRLHSEAIVLLPSAVIGTIIKQKILPHFRGSDDL